MAEALYEDDQCIYYSGDPRFDQTFTPGMLVLYPGQVVFRTEDDTIGWPKGAVISVEYAPAQPMDWDEVRRTHGIDAAQDVALGLNSWRILRVRSGTLLIFKGSGFLSRRKCKSFPKKSDGWRTPS